MKYAIAILMMTTAPVAAQTFELRNNLSVDFVRMESIEWAAENRAWVRMSFTPNFEPEPFGPRPPTDVIGIMQELCERLAPNQSVRDFLAGIDGDQLELRWDWTPDEQEGPFTISRFHNNLFQVDGDACLPIEPFGRTNPRPPSGVEPRWRRSETTRDRSQDGLGLQVTYTLPQPLDSYDPDLLDQTAVELCISQATAIIARREEAYENVDYTFAKIQFEEYPEPNFTNAQGFVWPLAEDGTCTAFLPEAEVLQIREAME